MKWLLINVTIGTVFACVLIGIVIPAAPAPYRGPWLAFGIWLGTIVAFSLVSRSIRRAKH